MTTNKWQKAPESLVSLFYEVMENFPKAHLRKMFGYPCAFFQGNMFIGLHQSNMVLRLPRTVLESLFAQKHAIPFVPMENKVMKEYASLSNEVLGDKELLKNYISQSLAYVQVLPPKAPKKPRTSKR